MIMLLDTETDGQKGVYFDYEVTFPFGLQDWFKHILFVYFVHRT